ncbi:MAG: DUF305 domain-containing protein [Pyrinomonadaceae bacterium]
MYKIFTVIIFSALIWVAACSDKTEVAKTNTETDHTKMDHSKMDHSKMDHSTMNSSPNAASAPYDLQFLDTMIAHHQGAVEMAGPCASKAQHSEIKTLCSNIISSQQKEIAQMKTWREQWFAGKAPAINMQMPGMSDSMKGMDMKALDSLSGNAFDLEFIEQMSPHHEGAVVMAEEALQKSSRDEIKKLAKEIIKAQQAEIDQMASWQNKWLDGKQ